MPAPTTAPPTLPFGLWPSPLAASALASAQLRLSHPGFDPAGRHVWLEGRPGEGGRTVLVAGDGSGGTVDLTPPPADVRSRVNEYGGGAYTFLRGEVVYAHGAGGLWRQPPGGPAREIVAGGVWRFGDLVADEERERIIAVAERTTSAHEPETLVVAIDDRGQVTPLITGHDFFLSPTLSPDGRQLAYLAWDHPRMPWDASALSVATLDANGEVTGLRHVAGDATASAQQPSFADDGTLYFLLEKEGRWTLHRDGAQGPQPILGRVDAELGLPPWQLGMRSWALLDQRTALAAAITEGSTALVQIDLERGHATPLPIELASIAHVAAHRGHAVLLAGRAAAPAGVVALSPIESSAVQVSWLRTILPEILPRAFVSLAEPIRFATSAGDEAHGFFYPPHSPSAQAPSGTRPPLIVMSHGGPTAATSQAFNPLVQFWTTRGISVLDVNYRGSTGYGRAYRDRLLGQWGVFDVDDCVAGARALANEGRVDARRIAIRGSSAGGFTTLAALVSSDLFAAGASLYGVSDLAALASDTHKFEAHYLDGLVGPWPERSDLYRDRSPIHNADRLACPVIFFQGLDDKVVPPSQAERFVEVLREKGLPCELFTFAGEQHGFRRAETIATVIAAELDFYGRVLGFAACADADPTLT